MITNYICRNCHHNIFQRTVYCCEECANNARYEKEKNKRAAKKRQKKLQAKYEKMLSKVSIKPTYKLAMVTPEEYVEMCKQSAERNK